MNTNDLFQEIEQLKRDIKRYNRSWIQRIVWETYSNAIDARNSVLSFLTGRNE